MLLYLTEEESRDYADTLQSLRERVEYGTRDVPVEIVLDIRRLSPLRDKLEIELQMAQEIVPTDQIEGA